MTRTEPPCLTADELRALWYSHASHYVPADVPGVPDEATLAAIMAERGEDYYAALEAYREHNLEHGCQREDE